MRIRVTLDAFVLLAETFVQKQEERIEETEQDPFYG